MSMKAKKPKTLYKFLHTGLKSSRGDFTWELGKWYKIEGKLDICNNGFHASKTPLRAFEYVPGEIVAKVEVRGESIIQNDKECWSEMRIVKAWYWEKKNSVRLAIFAAEQVIDIYEKKHPTDKRPREAIEAAKAYVKNPTEENRRAERAAARAAWVGAWAWAWAGAAARAWTWARAAGAVKNLIPSLNKWFAEEIKKLKPVK